MQTFDQSAARTFLGIHLAHFARFCLYGISSLIMTSSTGTVERIILEGDGDVSAPPPHTHILTYTHTHTHTQVKIGSMLCFSAKLSLFITSDNFKKELIELGFVCNMK